MDTMWIGLDWIGTGLYWIGSYAFVFYIRRMCTTIFQKWIEKYLKVVHSLVINS
jgi:hypothetical protein